MSSIFHIRKFSISAGFVLGAFYAFAQSLSPAMLSSFCGSSTNGNTFLSSTMGQVAAVKLSAGGNIITAGFNGPEIELQVLFPLGQNMCPEKPIQIPYLAWGYVASQNLFEVQLSDSNGSFANATSIGAVNACHSGSISVNLPAALRQGSGYAIRLVSSSPAFVSKPVSVVINYSMCGRGGSLAAVGDPSTVGKPPHFTWTTTDSTPGEIPGLEKSNDGNAYAPLATQTAATTGGDPVVLDDNMPLEGPTFYRAHIRGKDGNSYYSNVVFLAPSGNSTFSAYPNPSNAVIHFWVSDAYGEIQIFNAEGRLMTSFIAGETDMPAIDVSTFASGIYLAVFQSGTNRLTCRFIKQ